MSDHEEMILPGEVESPDVLPENVRGFYAAGDDGKYRPRVGKTESGYAFEHVAGLRSSLEASRAEARAARQKAKEMEEVASRFEGINPDEALDALERLRSGKVTDKEQMAEREKALRKQLDEKHQAEIAKRDEMIEGYKKDAQERLVSADGLAAISRHGGNPDLLMPMVEKSVRVLPDDEGRLRAVIVNENGEPRVSLRDGETGEMTIDEWIGDIVKADPRFEGAFAQRARGGAGGDRPGGFRSGNGVAYDSKAPMTQRLMQAYKADERRGARPS